jgi:hypothetical protein
VTQLQNIWKCNYNDWSQVGGLPGKIVRILPSFGSGTRKYFINSLLQDGTEGDPGVGTPVTDLGNSGHIPVGDVNAGAPVTCDPVVNVSSGVLEENNGGEFLTATYRDRAQQFIFPYSAGKWVQQAQGNGNPSLDKRNGVRMGALAGVVLNTPGSGFYPATYPVRYLSSGDWRLNDATILPGASLTHTVHHVNASGVFDTTLQDSVPGAFVQSDVGLQVQGTGIADGTSILAVSDSTGVQNPCTTACDTATIKPGATAAISDGDITVGFAVVSERNPVNLATTNAEYPGVRYVMNSLPKNGPASSRVIARDIVGFDDQSASGFVSHLCNGDHKGDIEDAGFVPLPAIIPPTSLNLTPVTCRHIA